jgi:Domain of unknown function (DUF4124)
MKIARSFLHLSMVSALMLTLGAADTFASTSNHILYKCTDQAGVTLYTNQKTKDRTCTVLSVAVMAPPSQKGTSNGVAPAPTDRKTAAKTPTPADFPRVSGNDQKTRDNDRRAILDRELATEQANLEKAKVPTPASTTSPAARQAWQDSIALHERNIEALNKEISRLR